MKFSRGTRIRHILDDIIANKRSGKNYIAQTGWKRNGGKVQTSQQSREGQIFVDALEDGNSQKIMRGWQ